MASPLFGSALSGLNAAQRGLATVGHNITNANTPGYSRQRIDQVARPPHFTGGGFVGRGTSVENIRRSYDSFIASQIVTSQASASRLETLHELSSATDRMLGDASGSLAPALQQFFTAVHDATVDPASIAARGALLSAGEAVTQRLATLDQRLSEQTRALDQRMRTVTGEVNVLTSGIAELNQNILEAEGRSGGNPANDLRDQRDELVRQLSERIDVSAFEQDDGMVNISVARGEMLVAGSNAATLSVTAGRYDPAHSEIGLSLGSSTAVISEQVAGGVLGGILQYRAEVLEPARAAVGRIAIGLAEDINTRHRLGQDLEGQPGGDFFNPLGSGTAGVFAHVANTSATPATVAVSVTDSASLTTSDYVLSRSGTSYDLTRLSDGASTSLSGFPAAPVEVDGMRIEVTAGSLADSDSFKIVPTRLATAAAGMAISSPRDVALALPVRVETPPGNTGTLSITEASVNSPDNTLRVTFNSPATTFDVLDETTGATLASGVGYSSGGAITFNGVSFDISDGGSPPAAGDVFSVVRGVSQAASGNTGGGIAGLASVSAPDSALRDPVTITFDDPPSTFTVSGSSTGSPTSGISYVAGQPVSFNGWTVSMVGTPGAGDSFNIVPNSGGIGDSRNGLAMAALQVAGTLDGLTASYEESYGDLISRVGSQTNQAGTASDAQGAVLGELQDRQASVSGVNLDEEAADLLRYQASYQASAQVIRAADTLFQALLAAVAR